EVERLVDAFGVLVAEHVVGAGDHAAGAAGAQPAGDDLVEEVAPLEFLGWDRCSLAGSARRAP
ncbi:MAG TPA: hypothetical protein VHL53_08755, partial [Acidimicrobiia bacterium]|nr:hypothetical protein [Acidimicrobiia bacterium]